MNVKQVHFVITATEGPPARGKHLWYPFHDPTKRWHLVHFKCRLCEHGPYTARQIESVISDRCFARILW